MADCFHERREEPDIRARQKLGFHTMRPNHASPGSGLGRYCLNRQLFRFHSDKRAAPVLCLAKRFFPDEPIESHTDACRAAITQMNVDFSARNVLVTHQFVTGASTCESEELSVGGSDNVDASVFDGFDYVALGHIHGPQNIDSSRIRYCGTPLKYSFSEAAHHKSVTVVSLGEKGDLSLQLCPLYPKHDLREIRGSFASVTDREFYANTDTDDYLHIILTDEEDVPEAVGKLRRIYPNLMKLSYDNTRTRADHVIDAAANVQQKTPLQLFEELYELQNNQPMSEEQRTFTQNLIGQIREEHA